MTSPCYNCPNRHIGCHGECEKYEKFDRANKERRQAEFTRKRTDHTTGRPRRS